MKLENANTVFSHRVTGGSEYCWQCWPNARYMDYESDYAHGSVVFSTVDGMIYEATVTHKEDDYTIGPYRWVNPAWKSAHDTEAKKRGVDPREAWDDVRWVDLEVWDDFAEKAGAMFNGRAFDTRIVVPIDLDDATMLRLCLEAHKQDITLNQLVERILRAEIEAAGLIEDRDVAEANRELQSVTQGDIEHSSHWYDTDRNR